MHTEKIQIVQRLDQNRGDSYRIEVEGDDKPARIFMVPKTMKGNYDALYTPQVISLGPYHFLQPQLADMEFEKSKIIARVVMSKLPPVFFTPIQKVRDGGGLDSDLQHDNSFFGSIVPHCRDFYEDQFHQNLNEETFAKMMFRDSSFLLVFLEHVANENRTPYNQQAHSHGRSPFQGLKSGNGLYLDIMKDVIKLENQIPLSALNSLYDLVGDPNQKFEAFVAQICCQYSPLYIQPNEDQGLATKYHLLHCLHSSVIYSKSPKDVAQYPANGWPFLKWLKKHSLCFRSRSRMRNGKSDKKGQDPTRLFGLNVLPSALKLSKAGVKFRHYDGGIEQIRFDEAQSALYLPVLKIGILTETIVRNLIAFELCSSEIEKNCVTSFARLLEELIQTTKDAEELRRNEVLVNWVGSDDKLVEIVKNVSGTCTCKPYFKPVNDARSSLKSYYGRSTRRILWSEFVDTYCSKPWVLIPAVAASVLLVMTALQVFCLFYTCNKYA